jgi:hypothetical protein
MSDEKSDYQRLPEVPKELQLRFEVMKAVMGGQLTVAEGARQLGLSRVRFQTLYHRALSGLLGELNPKPGRPPKPQREAELEARLDATLKENARLKERVDTVDRLLGVASDLVRGKVKLTGRGRQAGAEKTAEDTSSESDEPDGEARRKLEGVRALKALGLDTALAAALVASSPSTLRRHAARQRRKQPLVHFRGPKRDVPTPEQIHAGANVVRSMQGLIGAAALAHAVPALSRRKAAEVKALTLTRMERERRETCESVIVTVPSIMRSFDAMYATTTTGTAYLLAVADAAVPYRTLLDAVHRYDSQSVAAALAKDIELNGAPLVYRMDRARCHDTDEVRAVLDAHGVLMLHGPPRHPQYYGQLERQNREHRAWLNVCGTLTVSELQQEAERMRYAFNCTLPRRSLSWQTACEAWAGQEIVEVDRKAFRSEVQDRAARIQRQLEDRGEHAGQSERYAIEATLTKYGWLVRQMGTGC